MYFETVYRAELCCSDLKKLFNKYSIHKTINQFKRYLMKIYNSFEDIEMELEQLPKRR
jgi:hypothetical protein